MGSQKNYLVKNEKGLFAYLSKIPLITEEDMQKLAKAIGTPYLNEKQEQTAARAIEILSQLPISAFAEKNTNTPTRYWCSPSRFISSSRDLVQPQSSAAECGWGAVGDLVRILPELNPVLEKLRVTPINPNLLYGAAKIGIRSANWTFERSMGEREDQGSSWAIFVPFGGDKTQGYLDAKNNFGPLPRARLFESEEAARLAARAKSFPGAILVEIALQMKSVVLPSDMKVNPLGEALAKAEIRQLQESLEKAGVEQLRARMAQLESENNKVPHEDKSIMRRRM